MKRVLVLILLLSSLTFAQHTVKLSWTAPTKDVNGFPLPATGCNTPPNDPQQACALTLYHILRAAAQGGPFVAIGTSGPSVPNFTDTPPPCSTSCTFWYEVTADNGPPSAPNSSAPIGPVAAVIPAAAVAIPSSPTTLIIQVQ